ncbi:MAG: cupin domain-containing protein [Woeseiaceae bacterium]|nr:cupin domain-containing protein [Woeseiaceae bacterium]
MAQAASAAQRHAALLAERLVRYGDLRPCTTAFIDTRTPGSVAKENFTIIGPGVAENPDQHVHIDIPHGFNVGGARQPPGCVNSQHSHETAEVFVVHSGTWAFTLGANREDGEVVLQRGDTISIPVHVFRGFENVGDDTGFLFAVLGGDDPGHVTWAPYVFDEATKHGLILLEDGSLVDTTRGEAVPQGKRPMPRTTADDVARLKQLTADELAACVVRYDELTRRAASTGDGVWEHPIIGSEAPAEGLDAGKMAWPHGFHLRHLRVRAGAATTTHVRHEEEVIMMHAGRLTLTLPDGSVELGAGDVITVPIGLARKFKNPGPDDVEAYVVRGGDAPRPPAPAHGPDLSRTPP